MKHPNRLIFILCLLLLSLPTHANNCPTPQGKQPLRLALLIGNADYPPYSSTNLFDPLHGAQNDVKNMRTALKQYGFQIPDAFYLQNATLSQMRTAVSQFATCLSQHKNSVGLFFYAGHGIQGDNPNTGTHNYLLPVGRHFLDNADVIDGGISADWVLDKMAASGAKVRIMVLDACRNRLPLKDPHARGGAGKTGFVGMNATGALIGYAAAKNKQSFEDPNSRSGIYTSQLITAMQENAHLPLELVFKRAGEKASQRAKALGQQQNPWSSGGLQGDFCLGICNMQGNRQADAETTQRLQAIQAQIDALKQQQSVPQVSQLQRELQQREAAMARLQAQLEALRRAHQTPDFTAELNTCTAHLNANRLTRGNSGNALDCYKNVLRQDAGNAQALQGLAAVENTFVTLIDSKIAAGDLTTAQSYIQRLQSLNAEHRELTRLQQDMGAAKLELSRSQGSRSQRITVPGRTYIAYANGTALDTKTNLLWMRCYVGQTWTGSTCSGEAKRFDWEDAKKQSANVAGYSDWRIPSIEELRTLVYCSSGQPAYFNPDPVQDPDDFDCDGDYQHPTLVQSVFPGAPEYYWVWSGSPVSGNTFNAWVVDFGYGYGANHDRDNARHVRLVRERQ